MSLYLNIVFSILSFILMNLWFYKAYQKFNADPEIINIDIVDNRAYWVYDGVIYYADVIDNRIDNTTKRKIKV